METFNPVVSGLVHAMSLASMFQRMSLEREQIERQKHKDKREEQLQDFSLKDRLLNEGAKTVSPDGRYTHNIETQNPAAGATGSTMPVTPGALPDFLDQPGSTATSVPVDKGRVMTAPDGTKFYRPTDDEKFEEAFPRHMKQMKAETDVKAQAIISESIAKLHEQLANIGYTQDRIDHRTLQQDMFTAGQNDANRRNQLVIATGNNQTSTDNNIRTNATSRINNANTNGTSRANNADTNATSTANNIRTNQTHAANTDKLTAGRPQRTDEKSRAELQKIEREEYGTSSQPGIHAQLENIGIMLRSGKEKDRNGDEVNLTADARAKLDAKAKLLTTRRDQLLKRKRELGYSTDSQSATPPPPQRYTAGSDPLGLQR